MPFYERFKFFIIAHCDFFSWVEAKPLCTVFFWAVADFFWENVICCHGYFGKLVINGGSENKDVVAKLAERYGVIRVVVSAYHPQTNGIIEHGHKPVLDALSKMSTRGSINLIPNLPTVL